jgi:1-acyl-sn-glycerol-3-phosphate acyltransferase
MLYFLSGFLWSWIVVPFLFVVLRPFVRLDSQTNSYHFLYNILGIKHKITGDPLIEQGFILCNHRCFLDFMIDSYVSDATCIGRALTILAVPFIQLLAYVDNRTIIINRNKDNRHDVYSKCVSHINNYQNKRILFYPEGTRNKYTILNSSEELKPYIKFGLLKSIYEDKRYPVQLVISNNKENAFNEKRLLANYGVPINTVISSAIHPKDFDTDVEFFDKVLNVWFNCYVECHSDSNKKD